MDSLRRALVHRALTRHQLMLGCDRDLFFMLLLLTLILTFSGLMGGHLHNIIFAIILWLVGVPILAKLALYDSYFKDILVRSLRYPQAYLPACGKLGDNVLQVFHKRW